MQGEIEKSLAALYKCPVRIHPSGRTDTGVHALRQYAHFSVARGLAPPPERAADALNTLLPPDIRAQYSKAVDDDFHARFSAERRTYCYAFYPASRVPAPLRLVRAPSGEQVNWRRFLRDARQLVGRHDFANACTGAPLMKSREQSTVRTVRRVALVRGEDAVFFFIEADGFLWRMVRTLSGLLLRRALMSKAEYASRPGVRALLRDEKRSARDIVGCAPACGLFLYDVRYNGRYGLPYVGVPSSRL